MIRGFIAFLLCFAVKAPAYGHILGASELKIGIPAQGTASSKPVADVYYMAGESGAKEAYTFTGKGPASLTLFGPDGSEILTASGMGTVRLEVILPFTDVFTLAVERKTQGRPYSLSRTATVPTFAEAFIAKGVGYFDTCWLIPGVKIRRTYSKGFEDVTLAADRHSLSFVSHGPRGIRAGDVSVTYDGTKVHQLAKFADGTTRDVSFDFTPTFNLSPSNRFKDYLCKL